MIWLFKLGAMLFGDKLAKVGGWGILIVAVGLALFAVSQCARQDERQDRREKDLQATVDQRDTENKVREAENKRRADGNARDRAQLDEVKNATDRLPDSRPSDRQRARACAELRYTPAGCTDLRRQ